jgi:hypothetical protein
MAWLKLTAVSSGSKATQRAQLIKTWNTIKDRRLSIKIRQNILHGHLDDDVTQCEHEGSK